MTKSLEAIVQEKTGGRPFVFVIMKFDPDWNDCYATIKSIIENEMNRKCLRADEIGSAGHDLLETIHFFIDRAELVVAEISSTSENVYYEVGYAIGRNRPLFLLSNAQRNVPSDLKGRSLFIYHEFGDSFEHRLRKELLDRLGPRYRLLRDMLLGPNPAPSYIAASPRYPSDRNSVPGQRRDRRTFADNLGIRGLLQSFGSLLGEDSGVELVSAQYCATSLMEEPVNLYLIGSKKVNPLAGEMLRLIQADRGGDRWYFGLMPVDHRSGNHLPQAERESAEKGDYLCRLYEITANSCKLWAGRSMEASDGFGVVHEVDYGLVIRAPHPQHPDRVVMLMAGAHSLGTGAACLAATRSSLIEQIVSRLPDSRSLANKNNAFWALVKGTANADGMLDDSGVTVEQCDWFPDRNTTTRRLP
jgi:hypothetical protein